MLFNKPIHHSQCILKAPQVMLAPRGNLIRSLGPITAHDVEILRERLTLAGDTRDVLAARDSIKQFLGLRLLDP
jgi:hypothetical protein